MSNVLLRNAFLGALALAQCCSADTVEVEGSSDVPRQTGTYVPPDVPGYPPTGDRCSASIDLVREAALDETTTLGFSGNDVLARFNEAGHGALRWADGSETEITFHAKSSAETIRYDDFPKDAGYCTPTMNVPLDELMIQTADGVIDARLVPGPGPFPSFELVASIDGHGGIGLIFDSSFTLEAEQVALPLVDAAIAAHPDHDRRHIAIELSWSDIGRKSRCIKDEEISEDPAHHCNIFDGVLRYHSSNSIALQDHHNIPPGALYNEALASWFWTQ